MARVTSTQLATQISGAGRTITINRPQRFDPPPEADDPLFVNVLRRRWMLLTVCALLSAAAATLVALNFDLPKAVSTGQLRHVPLPPTLEEVYRQPSPVEMVEILKRQSNISELARRNGLKVDTKTLAKRLDITADRFSNIIDIELKWKDAAQAIDMVNGFMDIAIETTVAARKQTLGHYRLETEKAYEAANQRVTEYRDELLALRRQRESELGRDGVINAESQVFLSKLTRCEELLDEAALKKSSLSRQIATLRADLMSTETQIKQELLKSRLGQATQRQASYNPNSSLAGRIKSVLEELGRFEEENQSLDYTAWRAKLEAVGQELLGPVDIATLAAIKTLESELVYKEQKIEQYELELLPMDGEIAMLEKRRESLDRRLADVTGSEELSATAIEEAIAKMEDAQRSLWRIQEQLDHIQRLEQTNFNEMTKMTEASWQTTEVSDGKNKLFVLTFAGCFALLIVPVFVIEHFFPSGDTAERAARSLGVPLVSRDTFLASRRDQFPLYPVNSESLRLLALRIQQSVPGAGSVVLFSGLNHDQSSIPMVSFLAECLARREERVLIIDACDRTDERSSKRKTKSEVHDMIRPQADERMSRSDDQQAKTGGEGATDTKLAEVSSTLRPGLVGLAEYLQHRDVPVDDLICPTTIPGVDVISSGSTRFPAEGLATNCLTELLAECRRRYTMILVDGPSTRHPSDLQMLCARADAILFTVPKSGRSASKGDDVVRDLLDLGAPVIGIVG